jgi:hypothetical protein
LGTHQHTIVLILPENPGSHADSLAPVELSNR